MKKLISERALLARINRALSGEILKKCRIDSRQWSSLGDYYTVDLNSNAVIHTDIDLEAYGRELGCLEEYEELDKKQVEIDRLKASIEFINKMQAEYDAMTDKQKAAMPKDVQKMYGG